MKRLSAPLLILATIIGCSEDHPDCTPGDGAGGSSSYVTVGAGPGVSAASGGDWAEPEHGYSRNAEGEVCACDAADDAQRGCVDDPPAEGKPMVTDCDPESTGDGSCEGPNPTTGDAYHGKPKPKPAPKPPEVKSWLCTASAKCVEDDNPDAWFWVGGYGVGNGINGVIEAQAMAVERMNAKCHEVAKNSAHVVKPVTFTCNPTG